MRLVLSQFSTWHYHKLLKNEKYKYLYTFYDGKHLVIIRSASFVVDLHQIIVPWLAADSNEDDGQRELAANKHKPWNHVQKHVFIVF